VNFFKWRLNNQESVEIIQGEERAIIIRLMDENYAPIDLSAASEVRAQLAKADGIGCVTRSSVKPTFLPAAVDVTGNTIALPDHGLVTNDKFQLTSGGTLPAGLALSTDYFAKVVDKDTLQLAAALDGDAIDLTDAGSGTHQIELAPLAITSGTLGKVTLTLGAAASAALKSGEKQTIEVEYTIAGTKRIAQLTKVLTVLEQAD
jgi:hypothetical protein